MFPKVHPRDIRSEPGSFFFDFDVPQNLILDILQGYQMRIILKII